MGRDSTRALLLRSLTFFSTSHARYSHHLFHNLTLSLESLSALVQACAESSWGLTVSGCVHFVDKTLVTFDERCFEAKDQLTRLLSLFGKLLILNFKLHLSNLVSGTKFSSLRFKELKEVIFLKLPAVVN